MAFTKTEVDTAIGGAHGSIYVDDGAVAQTIATGASYVKVTAFTTDGNSNNITTDAANDKITFTVPGTYHATASCSFTAATNLVNWFGAMFLDGVEQDNLHFERKIGTGGDYGSATLSGLINVTTVPADVDFRVRHDKVSSDDITVRYSNMMVHLVGQ